MPPSTGPSGDAPRPTTTIEVLGLLRQRGESGYGGEAVTQREHALQAALLAIREGTPATLVVAALLHDVGHLLHELPDDAPDRGIDDRHEVAGARWLAARFGPFVVEPVRLHVASKRYLCAVEPAYFETLSPPSVRSLELQGGPMSEAEVREFRALPHWSEAVRLRRWDDEAKVPGLPLPELEHFAPFLERAARESPPCP